MIKIALQLCPVVRPDFIVELLHEKILGIVVLGLLWCNVGFARVVD